MLPVALLTSTPHGDAATTEVSDHVPLRGRASLLRGLDSGGGPGPGGPGDQPPTVDAGPPVGGDEGSAIQLLGSATDPEGTPSVSWSYASVGGVDPGTSCSFADRNSTRTAINCNDDGVFRATLSASDGVNPAVMTAPWSRCACAAAAVAGRPEAVVGLPRGHAGVAGRVVHRPGCQ